MTNAKKLVVLALVFTILIGCFTGCAPQTPADADAEPTEGKYPDRAYEILAGSH
jgi:hypothetical protein